MELSQQRRCGAQGAKPTHDFLSLYSPAQQQQDPPPIIPGGYLKTQDFLQPLEREDNQYIETRLPPHPPTSVEHILPGGIGTYSISHISCINQTQKAPKPERVVITAPQSSSSDKNDENSNCSSYTESGFALWDEHNLKNGKTRKENYSSLNRGDLLAKVNCSNADQKPNTPRSKHSATEQRRRSKIKDRFLMLRELIPHGDQKRDKASFLLEVVEYIQFLQEKVHKYEDSYQRWPIEPPSNRGSEPAFGFSAEPLSNIQVSDSCMSSRDAIGQHPLFNNKPSTLWHSRSCATDTIVASDKLKDEELIIESGTINISTVYSQGLSSALTQALQSSGVDLSDANISVQIDLRKRSNTKNETRIDQPEAHSGFGSTREDGNGEGFKRLKTSGN